MPEIAFRAKYFLLGVVVTLAAGLAGWGALSVFASVSSSTAVSIDGSGNLSLVAGGSSVWTAATNGVAYTSTEALSSMADGSAECASQAIGDNEVWEGLVRVERATDAANTHFYEVTIANTYYSPGYTVTVTDLGGGPTASATFTVAQTGSGCVSGDSDGTTPIVLKVTGSTGGYGNWEGSIYWRLLSA